MTTLPVLPTLPAVAWDDSVSARAIYIEAEILRGVKRADIARVMGVHHTTLSSFVSAHLPHLLLNYSRRATRARNGRTIPPALLTNFQPGDPPR